MPASRWHPTAPEQQPVDPLSDCPAARSASSSPSSTCTSESCRRASAIMRRRLPRGAGCVEQQRPRPPAHARSQQPEHACADLPGPRLSGVGSHAEAGSPGMAAAAELSAAVAVLVSGAGEVGCGLEAQLEAGTAFSWIRIPTCRSRWKVPWPCPRARTPICSSSAETS